MLNRSAVPLIVLVGGLSGLVLAPDPAFATLPVALNVVGLGAGTYPAASIMRCIGRRTGFVLASAVGGLSAIAAALSIMAGSFTGLCIACAVLGTNQSFVHQYRFAAAENVPQSRVSQAISLLLFVSLVSALPSFTFSQRCCSQAIETSTRHRRPPRARSGRWERFFRSRRTWSRCRRRRWRTP